MKILQALNSVSDVTASKESASMAIRLRDEIEALRVDFLHADIVRTLQEHQDALAAIRTGEWATASAKAAEEARLAWQKLSHELAEDRVRAATLIWECPSWGGLIAEELSKLDMKTELIRYGPSCGDLIGEALSGIAAQSSVSSFLEEQEAQAQRVQRALREEFELITRLSLSAEAKIGDISWARLGLSTSLQFEDFEPVTTSFETQAERYLDLGLSFSHIERAVIELPPVASLGPPVEVALCANVMRSLPREEPESEDSNGELWTESKPQHLELSLEELLAAIDPELARAWLGAKQALRSSNPDRARHVFVSLRELVDHAVRRLAPTDQVREWASGAPKYLQEGDRPTRAARLLYISRGVNHGPFAPFVDANVRAKIEFFKLFQRGVHGLAVDFTQHQLEVLVLEAGSLLRFLLTTANLKN